MKKILRGAFEGAKILTVGAITLGVITIIVSLVLQVLFGSGLRSLSNADSFEGAMFVTFIMGLLGGAIVGAIKGGDWIRKERVFAGLTMGMGGELFITGMVVGGYLGWSIGENAGEGIGILCGVIGILCGSIGSIGALIGFIKGGEWIKNKRQTAGLIIKIGGGLFLFSIVVQFILRTIKEGTVPTLLETIMLFGFLPVAGLIGGMWWNHHNKKRLKECPQKDEKATNDFNKFLELAGNKYDNADSKHPEESFHATS